MCLIVNVSVTILGNVFNPFIVKKFSSKEPGGWQRGLGCREKLRFIALKIRAMAQYGGGRGGGSVDKKRFRQTPLLIFEFWSRVRFLKNIV